MRPTRSAFAVVAAVLRATCLLKSRNAKKEYFELEDGDVKNSFRGREPQRTEPRTEPSEPRPDPRPPPLVTPFTLVFCSKHQQQDSLWESLATIDIKNSFKAQVTCPTPCPYPMHVLKRKNDDEFLELKEDDIKKSFRVAHTTQRTAHSSAQRRV